MHTDVVHTDVMELTMKLFAAIALLCLGGPAHATSATEKTDYKAVETACAPEGAASSCNGKPHFVPCLYNYRKATKGFKFSPACHQAIATNDAEWRKEKGAAAPIKK